MINWDGVDTFWHSDSKLTRRVRMVAASPLILLWLAFVLLGVLCWMIVDLCWYCANSVAGN